MKFVKGDMVRIKTPSCPDSPFNGAKGVVRCYEAGGVWVDVPKLGEHFASEVNLVCYPAIGTKVRIVRIPDGLTDEELAVSEAHMNCVGIVESIDPVEWPFIYDINIRFDDGVCYGFGHDEFEVVDDDNA